MRITHQGNEWTGDEPRGSEGLRLFRRVAGLIASERLHARLANPVEAAAALASHPDGEAVLLATFAGWSRGGRQINRAALDFLAAPETILEPWLVCLEVWGRLGFFGPAVLGALQGLDARQAG